MGKSPHFVYPTETILLLRVKINKRKGGYMPLILTENARTVGGRYDHWEDATGVWYHFPNGYLNNIEAHEKFIYYRGKRREEGLGLPEYFGYGRLGETWRDTEVDETEPKGRWRWYVELDDYVAFTEPVSFKEADQYIEDVRHTNHFGTAVRVISDDVYERILSLAGSGQARRDRITVRALPHLESLALESKDVEVIFQTTKVRGTATGQTRSTPRRRAKDSKIVGDRAEAIVHDLLCRSNVGVRWLARDGIAPGWD